MVAAGRGWSAYLGCLGTGVLLVGLLASSPAGAADESGGERVRRAAAAPPHFPQGPSLRETGRIGPMSPQGSGEIVRDDQLGMPSDVTVQQVAAVDSRPAGTSGAGSIDPEVLNREVESRLASAQACLIEVARRKQVAPAEVMASPLTLRWTILPSGAVSSTAVIIRTVDDADLADCVKHQMVSWTFTRPRGGQVNIERTFQLSQR